MEIKTVPQVLRATFLKYPKYAAQYYKDENKNFQPITYEELYNRVLTFASGLMSKGCVRGQKIGVIMDNRPEWMVCTLGILTAGMVDAPRGTNSTVGELEHIFSITECKVVIAETQNAFTKIIQAKDSCPLLETVITINDFEIPSDTKGIKVIPYNEIMELGKKDFEKNAPDKEMLKGESDDLATIIFTSGTTGLPKGVMLTHKNFVAQMPELAKIILISPGRSAISVLPIWHSFERECEFLVIYCAAAIYYSSPIASVLLPDLAKANPYVFPSVPRVWEAIYDAIFKMMKKNGGIKYKIFQAAVAIGTFWKERQIKLAGRWCKLKKSERITQPLSAFFPVVFLFPFYLLADLLVFRNIRVKFGKNFKHGGGVSGGAALPRNVDMFFAAAGLNLCEGYGITETAPVICCRDMHHPISGTVGKPIACLTAKIVDAEDKELPPGVEGEVWIKGDTVMKGYYRDEEKTRAVLTPDGWFKTGDIGLLTIDGDLVLRGRVKDTIVLRGGENIEPVPIEMKLQESQLINTAVVVGQDQRNLAALIVVDDVSLKQWLKENNISYTDFDEVLLSDEVQNLYASEIRGLISAKNGFKMFEMIGKFKLLSKRFEVGVELSIKTEVMRNKIPGLYEKELKELFSDK